MTGQLRKLLTLFDRRTKKRAGLLLVLFVAGSALEAAGIGLVFPFIQLISDPGAVRSNAWLEPLYRFADPDDPNAFVLIMGGAIFTVFLVKNLYLAGLTWLKHRFIQTAQAELSTHLFGGYMRLPYAYHLRRHSAEMIRNSVHSSAAVCLNVAMVYINLAVEVLVIVAIATILIVIAPGAALIAFAVLGGVAGLFIIAIRPRAAAWGRETQTLSQSVIKWITQGLGAIKDARIFGTEDYFRDGFSQAAHRRGWYAALYSTANEIPRYLIETLMVCGLFAVVGLAILEGQSLKELLPTLGLFAIAAIRLMPSGYRIVTYANSLKFGAAALDDVHADAVAFAAETDEVETVGRARAEPPPLTEGIALEGVSFTYEGAEAPALHDVSFTIPVGASIAIVGASGAGKSTLVNAILGLMRPDSGRVRADGADIWDDIRAWRRRIGYVPQSIYLLDETLRRNIAFGIDAGEIDDDRVAEACALARLDGFVAGLPDRLDTVIGENGVRISGGQRQRLGIARALYHRPAVVVMDEALSALDGETEREITQAINKLRGERTVIVIAHRLSTVRDCDQIVLLQDGRVEAVGGFSDLMATSEAFRRVARFSDLSAADAGEEEPTSVESTV